MRRHDRGSWARGSLEKSFRHGQEAWQQVVGMGQEWGSEGAHLLLRT